MGCLSRQGLACTPPLRRAYTPSAARSRPGLVPHNCMTQHSGVLYHVHDGSCPLVLDVAPGRGFVCVDLLATSPGDAAAGVAAHPASTAVGIILSAGTWGQPQLVALLAALADRHPWAFLVLWHPAATEDPALRLAAWAAGAHMVTADLVALGAALGTLAASRSPPAHPLTHVTHQQLQDGVEWFQLQRQPPPPAAAAAPDAAGMVATGGAQTGDNRDDQTPAAPLPAAAATPTAGAAAATAAAGTLPSSGQVGVACSCPCCGLPGLSPAGLWYHTPLHHCYHDNLAGRCPICHLTTDNLAVHIHASHSPYPSTPEERTGVFALVVVRRTSDGAFLMVQEFAQQGYWVPGGGVDPGEGLRAAALRETLEEAGVVVELKGVLQVSWGHQYRWRRVIFYAEPVGDAGPHLKEAAQGAGAGAGVDTAAAAAAAEGGSKGGGGNRRHGIGQVGSTTAVAAAAAGGGVEGGALPASRVVAHHVAATLPQAIQLAQQQQLLAAAAGARSEEPGVGSIPAAAAVVVPKTLPDFESAGACWVRLEQLGQLRLRSAEVPMTWFPHVAGGGAMEPLVQPECWQEAFQGWEW